MISRRSALLTIAGMGLAGSASVAGFCQLKELGDGMESFSSGGAEGMASAASGTTAAPPSVTATPKAARLIAAARNQIGVTTGYDPAYLNIAYPEGDPPRAIGVCTDVVIRAYRDALNLDLQVQVHQDMAAHFGSYPHSWGLTRTDTNIDHRRVPNLRCYFTRKKASLALDRDWRPGDLYTCLVNGTLPHIGVVSDRLGPSGQLYLIHNMGQGTREEDLQGYFHPNGHYRWLV